MKNWRTNTALAIFLLISATLVGRLIYIQIMNGSYYKALSQGLHSPTQEAEGERGEIFLASGEPFAINVEWPLVFVNPKKIDDIPVATSKLSEILSLKQGEVSNRLKQEGSYVVIKKKLSSEEVKALQKLQMPGIYLSKEKGRYYPQEELASQVIGFMGAEKRGQYGLEESYNNELQGDIGLLEPRKGKDLISTIDYNIQFKAEQLLKKAKKELEIEEGQIVVIEPNTGDIMAIAHIPRFDPNNYSQYAEKGELDVFKNKTTQEIFEPGSVFKPITMSAALEEGKISPDTTYIDTGSVKIGSYTIYNYDQRTYDGKQTMTNVLEKSINTGAIFVQRELGPNLFLKYIQDFGFFEPTGIDVRETFSLNPELKKSREINLATASFGQGIEITPMQLIRSYCAIANGGRLVTPRLIKTIDEKPKKVKDQPQQIISSKTASQLTAMMVSVVENGFAKSAKIPGYFVAGKTGTAQVSYGALGVDKEGYSDKTVQSFLGFAPAFNPHFLVLIKLNSPNTKTAEYSAVPLFKDLGEYIIQQQQIIPDYQIEENNDE